MTTYCAVYGCPNKGSVKLTIDPLIPVSFHRFPNKLVTPELHDKWLQQIRSPGFAPSTGSFVCSNHFSTDDFEWKESLQSIQLKARFFPGEYHPPAPRLKNTAFPSLHITTPRPTTDGSKPMCETERLKSLKKRGGKLNEVQNKKLHVSRPTSYKHLRNIKEKKFVDKGIQCELGIETYRSQPGVTSNCGNQENSPAQCNINVGLDWLNDVDSISSEDSYRVTSSEHDSESEYSSINDYEEDEMLTTSLMGINEETRAGRNDWCKCGICIPMNAEYESSCCHECEPMLKVRETHECVTSHKSFKVVVLDEHVLNTSRHFMILSSDSLDAKNELKVKTNRLLRHIAYKQFINWVNSKVSFGHNTIKVIPACVISKVRTTFPEASGVYRELEPAKRGYEPDYFD